MTTTTAIYLIVFGMVLVVQMIIMVATIFQVSAATKQIATCKCCNKKSNRGPVFMGPSGKGQFKKSMSFGNSPKISRNRKVGGIH